MNRRKLTRLILAATAGLTMASASAAPLNLLGLDDMSCTAWSQSKDDEDVRAAYVVWVRGFLTGHNYALPNQQVSSFSSSTLALKLDQYCRRNPTGQVSDAAMRLSDEMSGRNKPIKK
ncbi:MAG: hypothetical protein KKE51_14215 [Gammaproteobacteria bacterium]|nr:hypothetical protein [Gammaproteobacteria bacterium]MBU1601863.1 hypothetical protein [Gammaproteobacteria bacterium]MBU2432235.1 hypothetical protein [Gammaproteobacteria bacterium]MBU2450372.1 hypothetical protein [Gammaproteobacteria bacterium]